MGDFRGGLGGGDDFGGEKTKKMSCHTYKNYIFLIFKCTNFEQELPLKSFSKQY